MGRVQMYAFKMKRLFLIVMLVTLANATWLMPGHDHPFDQHPGVYQHGEETLELLLDNPIFSRNIKKRTADPKPQDDDPTKPGRFPAQPVRLAFGSQFSSQLQPSFRQFLSGGGFFVPV